MISLLKPIDSSPHENYVFMKLIQDQAKNIHFPKKTVKLNPKETQKIKMDDIWYIKFYQ